MVYFASLVILRDGVAFVLISSALSVMDRTAFLSVRSLNLASLDI